MNIHAEHPKLLKYRILRHLPRPWGARSREKYSRIMAPVLFEQAMGHTKGSVCIDLGAHVGIYTRLLALRAGMVIAFEPDPWTCAQLRQNVADLDNVRIENAATTTDNGRVSLYRHRQFNQDRVGHSVSSSILSQRKPLDKSKSVEVRQVDFVKYLEDLDEPIGVLKIDIEGSEVELLEALFARPDLLERIDYIFAETHERILPDLVPRYAKIKERARWIHRPRINLEWN